MSGDGRAPQDAVRIVLRPLASPLPLGLRGLGAGTTVLAGLQLGWVPSSQGHLVAAAVLLVAVPLQAAASAVGFLARDPAAATAMGTLAATWAVIGALLLVAPSSGTPIRALGLVLFFLAAAVLLSATVAASTKLLLALVLAAAGVRFALTGVYEWLGGTGWVHTAGWVGVALGALALGAAGAFEIEAARRARTVATGRRGAGRTVLSGDGLETVGPVAREAGVRDQL